MEDNNRYYQSRHFQRLLRRYEKAIAEGQLPYFEADELTDIAEYYMTGRQDDKANQAIRAAIDMHPEAADPQLFLARQKMFYGQTDEARAILDAITEQDDCEVIYVRAEILIKEGRADEASAYLLEQMELMQDSLDTYLYDCVAIFMDYDQWEQADEWTKRLREVYPTHPKLPIMEAEIKMGLDDYEGARPMFEQILEEQPYNSEAWNLLAETYVALEMYPEALEAADYSLAINPQDTNALLMKGNAYMRDQQMPPAIQHYTQYLEHQPDDLSVLLSLSVCYNTAERYEEALRTLAQAEHYATELPDHEADLSQIFLMRAFALSRQKKLSEALKAMKRARELADGQQMWQFDIAEGEIYLHSGQTKRAEDFFVRGLHDSTEQPETLFNIALAYSGAGYYDYAIDLFDDVWTLYGDEEGKFVVPYLADCYLSKNDTENFLMHLQLAPACDREATRHLFADRYPGIQPEEYYAYAYRDAYGHFPQAE